MKQLLSFSVCCFLLWTVAASAQAAKPNDEPRTVAQQLDAAATGMQKEFVPAAEAMPMASPEILINDSPFCLARLRKAILK